MRVQPVTLIDQRKHLVVEIIIDQLAFKYRELALALIKQVYALLGAVYVLVLN